MRLAHPAAVLALVGTLALAGCSSDDSDSAATPSSPAPSTTQSSATPATPASDAPSTDGSIEVVTLLSKNLEAYKKATGKYPEPGSPDYQRVIDIDQADGYTIGYGVDGAGAMTICASADGGSASYASKTGEVSTGGKGGCGA